MTTVVYTCLGRDPIYTLFLTSPLNAFTKFCTIALHVACWTA